MKKVEEVMVTNASIDTPTLQKLVDTMNGHDSTNQWDIVCSYSVAQLNHFLQLQYDANKLAKEVKLSTLRNDPFTGDKFHIDYDIHFASPALSFISGRSGFAKLKMEIREGSSYTIRESKKKTDIPAGKYSIASIVPLASIAGDTGTITGAEHIIEFSDGKKQEQHIILHMKNIDGATFQIVPTPDPKDKDPLETYFLPVLANYFKTEIQEIDYALTSVNNEKQSGKVVLTPKSFVFASAGTNSGGALSLYIQTEGSKNPPGNPNPSFQPGGMQITPIPTGYTASVILSSDLISNYYLRSQLKTKGYTISFINASEGLLANLVAGTSVIADGDSGHFAFGNHDYKGLSIPIDNHHPVQFRISNSNIFITWEGRTKSEWSEVTAQTGGGRWGSVHIEISLSKGPLAFVSLDDHSFQLLDLMITSSDFSVKVSKGSCSFLERLDRCVESYPPYYKKDMTLKMPDINLKLEGLDFFLTTNLLSPGKKIIKVDTKAGLKTPRDFLLVGEIVHHSSPGDL